MTQRDLMYCAIPSVFKDRAEEAANIAWNAGFHPIDAFGVDRFRPIEPTRGRGEALGFLGDLLELPRIKAFGLFGISDGTMYELRRALAAHKHIRLFLGFHNNWEEEYGKLVYKYGDVLAHVRGRNRLIVLCGKTASGKTYWRDRLIAEFGQYVTAVKNTTTRLPRDEADHASYNFVDRETFQLMLERGEFIEHDTPRGEYYGSSLAAVRQTLDEKNALTILTAKGVEAYARMHELHTEFYLLEPAEDLHRENLVRRGIVRRDQQDEIIAGRDAAWRMPDIAHLTTIRLAGDEDDAEEIYRAIRPWRNLALPRLPELPPLESI